MPTRDIEDVRPHCTVPLLVNNVSRKLIMIRKHTIIGVGTEPPTAVFTPSIDDEQEPQEWTRPTGVDSRKANS